MGESPISQKWLPAAWVDEWVPAPQQDPSAFIRGTVGELWMIAPEGQDDNETYRILVSPGDLVEFDLCRVWSDIEVTIGANLKIERHAAIPEDATLFWYDRDADTISDSLDNLIETLAADYELEPGTVEVEPYDWSISAQFRLIVDASGARFEKIEEGRFDG